MNERGQFNSLELVIWILVLLTILWTGLSWNGFLLQQTKQEWNALELERNAVMSLDSLVKNRLENESWLGTALFDTQKRRVQSNHLDSALLGTLSSTTGSPVFVQKLELVFEGSNQTIIEHGQGTNCLTLERAAVLENQLVRVRETICHE